MQAEGIFEDAEVVIAYSSPAVKGRTVWGDLVPYGKVWRTGANEATTFTTNKDIEIQGHILPAGKYALFTIPEASEWTWIFNADWDQWGAFKYDESKDILRLKVEPQASSVFYERMTFHVEEESVLLNWENLQISLN
jgi:hypothetical protein